MCQPNESSDAVDTSTWLNSTPMAFRWAHSKQTRPQSISAHWHTDIQTCTHTDGRTHAQTSTPESDRIVVVVAVDSLARPCTTTLDGRHFRRRPSAAARTRPSVRPSVSRRELTGSGLRAPYNRVASLSESLSVAFGLKAERVRTKSQMSDEC